MTDDCEEGYIVQDGVLVCTAKCGKEISVRRSETAMQTLSRRVEPLSSLIQQRGHTASTDVFQAGIDYLKSIAYT